MNLTPIIKLFLLFHFQLFLFSIYALAIGFFQALEHVKFFPSLNVLFPLLEIYALCILAFFSSLKSQHKYFFPKEVFYDHSIQNSALHLTQILYYNIIIISFITFISYYLFIYYLSLHSTVSSLTTDITFAMFATIDPCTYVLGT